MLKISDGRYWCDYGYHLAPIESGHLDEMEMVAVEHGVSSFKIFMFYGGYGLHGKADGDAQRRFLMLGPTTRTTSPTSSSSCARRSGSARHVPSWPST